MELSIDKTREKNQKQYRISTFEFEKICSLLGREPQGVEWALFSAMWSEHCSYKSSKNHLKKFSQTLNHTVINASGENAGVVDLGFGERIVFKMESHNHPSFIEPYQGAATGVGGILRDIFTMGARPIAIADYLCFGESTAPRMKELVDGVVRGIGGYGNCVGVPTISGQTEFHSSYNNNILVNAMAVGLLRPGEEVALSSAKGPGNWVIYVGAKTGKDGVHGAAMASESFDHDSESKKPNVQIGDPYFEKLLIESCFVVLQKKLVVAIQDMGAAGLTSSSFEMASKGQVGMKMDLSLVPLRDGTMTAEEILLSESQERMLLVCEPKKFSEIQKIFEAWGLDAVKVGEVIAEKKVELQFRGEIIASLNPDILVEEAPKYDRPYDTWSFPKKTTKENLKSNQMDILTYVQKSLASDEGSTRKPLYRQYDQRVGAMTAKACESSVALQKLPDSGRGLALAVGCRPFLMRIDARLGALDAVVYPILQMAAKGALAVAVTDCLNFGNPEKKEIMSEFVASVEAIKEASIVFETPVVSGNVSFYNETLGKNITSTPAIGLVGLRENVDNIPAETFQKVGNSVYLLSQSQAILDENSFCGELKLEDLKSFAKTLRGLQVVSSKVVGQGGLAITLARLSLHGLGFQLQVEKTKEDLMLETLYQVLVEVSSEQEKIFLQMSQDLRPEKIGIVIDKTLDFAKHGKLQTEVLAQKYNSGFLTIMGEV